MRILVTLSILLFANCSYAHFYIASSISYRHTSGNSYVVVFKTIRSCQALPLPSTTGLEIRDSANSYTAVLQRTSIVNVTLDQPNACNPANQTSSSAGFEEHTFEYALHLDTFAGGRFKNSCRLVFSTIMCCRNGSINTISPGSSYYECMIDRCLAKNNSGPVFMNTRNYYMRRNQPNYHNIIAIDTVDSDLLIYEPFTPMEDKNSPAKYSSGHSPRYPVTPLCSVSGQLNCSAVPLFQPPRGLYMDSLNGNMIFTPTISGEFGVVSYRVKEYRKINGIKRLVGYYITDKQFFGDQSPYNEPVLTKSTFKLEHHIVAGQSKSIQFATELNDTNKNDSVRIFFTNPVRNSSVSITSKWRSEAEFTWTPQCKDIRPEPYFFIIHFYKEGSGTSEFQSIAINIYVDPDLHIGNDTLICRNGQTLISSNITGKYKWNGNSSDSLKTFAANSAGKYWVDVTRNGCKISDTIVLTEITKKPDIDLGPDTLICNQAPNSAITLSTASQKDVRYSWDANPNHPYSFLNFTGKGRVIASAENVCGIVKDTIMIQRHNSPKLRLPGDTLLCTPYIYVPIIKQTLAEDWLWNTNSTDTSISINKEGLYWAEVSNTCGISRDSIYIESMQAPKVSLGNDTFVCNGNYPLLNASFPKANTVWSNGDTGTFLQTADSGIYTVKLSNQCGIARDSIRIRSQFTPKLDLGKDFINCQPTDHTFNAYFPYCTYAWNTAETSPSIRVAQAGTYGVKIRNLCGIASDSVIITEMKRPVVNLGKDTILKKPFKLTLNAGAGAESYLWNTSASDTLQFLEVEEFGFYSVRVGNACGFARDSIRITEETGIQDLAGIKFSLFPNPNNDGLLHIDCEKPGMVRIFSLSGELLKEFAQSDIPLDIHDLPSGTYMVFVILEGSRAARILVKQ